jgi:hypothetical protein
MKINRKTGDNRVFLSTLNGSDAFVLEPNGYVYMKSLDWMATKLIVRLVDGGIITQLDCKVIPVNLECNEV